MALALVLASVPTVGTAAQDAPDATERMPRQTVSCSLPPVLAALVDDSAAFATVPAADARAALDGMRACAASNPHDGATWFRTGYLAHLYHARAEADPTLMSRGERTRLRLEGDRAMQLGLGHAPDSARFWYLWNRVLQHRGEPLADALASRWLNKAQRLAESEGDSALLSRIHTERARRRWLDYDARADRAFVIGNSVSPVAEMFLRRFHPTAYEFMETSVRRVEPRTGLDQLSRIGDDTRVALAYDPANEAAWRLRYLAHLAFGAFDEIDAAAREQQRAAPDAWQPWLMLGYARHRLRRTGEAHAAFDSALARMPVYERAYWLGPGPILPRKMAESLGTLPPSQLLAQAEAVMARAAPFALQSANEVRSELLARRVEADLRFAQPELGVRGPESDRGVILVRYGPPDRVATFAPRTDGRTQVCKPGDVTGSLECVQPFDAGRVTVLWGYDALKQAFMFEGMPMFGTARFSGGFAGFTEAMREERPFDVSALGIGEGLRNASAQVVRLRGGAGGSGDSLTLLQAAAFPLAHVLERAVLEHVPMVVGAVLTAAPHARRVAMDSAREWMNADGPTTVRRQWELSAPADVRLEAARLEAFDPATGRGASASVPLDAFAVRGRGMSDVLLATRAADVAAARWPALAPTLAVGPVTEDSVVVAWELYDFAAEDRWAYDVTLTISRRERGGAFRMIGAALGSLRDLVRGASVDVSTDRVEIGYARMVSRPADGALLEVVTLGIGALEAGTYDVRVTVRDPARGWSETRGQVLEVAR